MPDQKWRCLVCNHPQRAEIERLIVSGEISQAETARRYGISKTTLSNHKIYHMGVDPVEKNHKLCIDAVPEKVVASRTVSKSSFVMPPVNQIVNQAATHVGEVNGITNETSKMVKPLNEVSHKKSIDDEILVHKIEITKLEHLKSLGIRHVE